MKTPLRSRLFVIVPLIAVLALASCDKNSPDTGRIPVIKAKEEEEPPKPPDNNVPEVKNEPAQPPVIPFNPPRIEPMLNEARDITGTWRGAGSSYEIDGNNGARIAKITWNVTIVIQVQNGTAVNGTIAMQSTKIENLTAAVIPPQNFPPTAFAGGGGTLSATSLYFNDGGWDWEFTFTTDTMSGQFTSNWPGQCDKKAFTLMKQR